MSELSPPEPSFEDFLEKSLAQLVKRNQENQEWGIDRAQRWQLDMDRRQLLFSMPDGQRYSAEPQVIGSLDTVRGQWRWSWANDSVDAPLREQAEAMRAYGERWTIPALTHPSWPGTEQDGWNMAALALRLFDSDGAYRAPSEGLVIFMTFRHVKKLAD